MRKEEERTVINFLLTLDDHWYRGILHHLGVLLQLLPDLYKLALEHVLPPAPVGAVSLLRVILNKTQDVTGHGDTVVRNVRMTLCH